MQYQRDTKCDGCNLWFAREEMNLDHGVILCPICTAKNEDAIEEHSVRADYEDVPASVEVVEHSNALLTRSSGGLRVEACYMPLTDLYGIALTFDGQQAWASVSKENFLDAFAHPVLYFPEAQIQKLGVR